MRYKEIEAAVLSLINQYSIAGEEVSPAYNNQSDYLRRIPGLINHALMDIRTSVKHKRAVYKLINGEKTNNGWVRYPLPEYFWRLCSGGVRLQTPRGVRRTNEYQLYGNQIIVRDFEDATYTIEFYAYPIQIPLNPDPEIEVDEEQDVIQIAEYFAGAQLVMQEDEFAYASLYNMYETRMGRLRPELTVEVRTVDDEYFPHDYPHISVGESVKSRFVTEEQVRTIVQEMIGGITGFQTEIVGELPETGDGNTIYLVQSGGAKRNIYDEYIYIESSGEWERIGGVDADEVNQAIQVALQGYVTETDLVTALEPYAKKTDLEPYAKTTEVTSAINTALEPYAKKDSLDGFVTGEGLANALTPYAKKTDLDAYAKTDDINSTLQDYVTTSDLDNTIETLDAVNANQNTRINGIDERVTALESSTKDAEQDAEITALQEENELLKGIIANSDIECYETAGPGNTLLINDAKSGAVKSAIVSIVPQQNNHGYDKPWPDGGGKNIMSFSTSDCKTTKFNYYGMWYDDTSGFGGETWEDSGIQCTLKYDDGNNFVGVLVNGTATYDVRFTLTLQTANPKTSIILSGCPSGGSASGYSLSCQNYDTTSQAYNKKYKGDIHTDTGSGVTFTNTTYNDFSIFIDVKNGTTCNSLMFKPMICASSAGSSFEPYSNISPITGITNVAIARTDGSGGSSATYNVSLSDVGTVYAGTLDVSNGTLTVTHVAKDLGDITWRIMDFNGHKAFVNSSTITPVGPSPVINGVQGALCSMYTPVYGVDNTLFERSCFSFNNSFTASTTSIFIYDSNKESLTNAQFKTAMAGQKIVYPLGTPVTYDLTAQEIQTLLGTNEFMTDFGNTLTITYKVDVSKKLNPSS